MHPISVIDRQNSSAIKPQFRSERQSGRIQTNTIESYFQPLQECRPGKRLGQEQHSTSSKIKCRKLNTSLTEEAGITDQDYKHQVKRRAHRKNDEIYINYYHTYQLVK